MTLNAPAEKDIYIKCDKDLIQKLKELKKTLHGNERHCVSRLIIKLMKGESLLLLKAIYGSKSAGRQWFLDIDSYLKDIGFVPNKAAPCFYSIILGEDFVILLLYVDDIVIGATTTALKAKYYSPPRKKYKMTFNEILTDFLIIALKRDRTKRQYHMSQATYVESFHETFQLPRDPSVQTQFTENLQIRSIERDDITPAQRAYVRKFPYKKLIGVVLYCNICTMPGISYAVSSLANFTSNPVFDECKELIRLCKFMYNDRLRGLTIGGRRAIVSYSGSDWAGDLEKRRSRSGCTTFIGNTPFSWLSKLKNDTALSTLQVEHNDMVPCIQNGTYCKKTMNVTRIPGLKYMRATSHYLDNDAAKAISTNPVITPKAKHIHIMYQYDLEQFLNNATEYCRVSSEDNCSDIFTKPVGKTIFKRHNETISGNGNIEPLSKRKKTISYHHFYCPRCEGKMTSDSQNRGNVEA